MHPQCSTLSTTDQGLFVERFYPKGDAIDRQVPNTLPAVTSLSCGHDRRKSISELARIA